MSYNLICAYQTFQKSQVFRFEVEEIHDNIISFLFYEYDINKAYLNLWKEKMKETLSIIDKEWKNTPSYEITGQKTFCVECYLRDFLKKKQEKKDIVTACEECFLLRNNGLYLGCEIIDFETIKTTTKFQPKFFRNDSIYFRQDRSIINLLNSSKFLAKENIYFRQITTIWNRDAVSSSFFTKELKKGILDLNFEIKFLRI